MASRSGSDDGETVKTKDRTGGTNISNMGCSGSSLLDPTQREARYIMLDCCSDGV